jgi:hypothetical protein
MENGIQVGKINLYETLNTLKTELCFVLFI